MLAGIFGRACAALHPDKKDNLQSVLSEATALKESLIDKLVSIKSSHQGSGVGELLPNLPYHIASLECHQTLCVGTCCHSFCT